MPSREPVAIVGMACLYPGAADLAAFWRNIESGFDAITDVPPERWDPVFYDPSATRPDRIYCRRGGFVDANATFDALAFGVMPVAARGAEPDQLLALQVASRALEDAGYGDRPLPRERAAVVLGRGGYLTPGMSRLDQYVRGAQQVVEILRAVVPGLSEADLEAVRHEIQSRLPAVGPDAAIGLVPNLAASRIANRLDLGGPAYTVDAACASSLVALDLACRDLSEGRADLALAGGVHLTHDVGFWSVFCQLGALSRSGSIRPFDRRADGLLIGEGVGIVVLKRLADAVREGDRIYAVVRGIGLSSDGRSATLMTPSVEGQLRALARAWEAARLDPADVGLLEAHGTGTPTGDAAELTTIARFFGGPVEPARRAALGSVKSMIGHAMPAAGAAGLIKAALAVHHGILPPTLHCEEPHPLIERTRFYPVPAARPWEAPRRLAAISAFGFGGINAHVVIEGPPAAPTRRRPGPSRSDAAPPLLLAAESPAALLEALDSGRSDVGSGPCRLAVLDPTPERRERMREIVRRGQARRGRDGLWFAPCGLVAEGGTVAFLFPGVEATFQPRVEDVARRFGRAAPAVPADPTDLEAVGLAIVGVGRLLAAVLAELGVVPQAIAGHSIGEWTGMIASGMIPEDDADAFVSSLVPGSLRVPGVVFAAVGCSAERARAAIAGLDDIALSHDNCPHQVVLCGRERSIDVALERLRREGVIGQRLPFRSGFHSPLFADYLEPHRAHVARVPLAPPRVPLWSATTCAPYPSDPDAVRALVIDHLVRPVRFRELVEALYAGGTRVFVQVGTGSLAAFVEDTLRGRPHVAISANVRERSGLEQLGRAAAQLFVEGVPVRVDRLWSRSAAAASRPIRLELGVPLVRPALRVGTGAPPTTAPRSARSPLLDEIDALGREIARAGDDVLAAWESARSAPRPRELVARRIFSLEAFPELADHCFFPQPAGWKRWSDRYPVVPMTTLLDLMMAEARRLVPGRAIVAIENARAYRWLAVAPPVEVTVTARHDGGDRVSVSIEGYSEGVVVLGDRHPAAPPFVDAALEDEAPAPITADQLYADRWMFHGPAFQGVASIDGVAAGGIRGVLRALPAPGALLDNAGQLLGYWVMLRADVDRLAMPWHIERVRFFGPLPDRGERVACAVHVHELGAKAVRADIDLALGDRVLVRIEGWEDRRFETDERLWAVLREPETRTLAERRPGGWWLLADRWRSAQSRDFLARRYLGENERAAYEAQGPRHRRAWLNGRLAAKDAVRGWLWERGHGPLFPVEVEIQNDAAGRPFARVPSGTGPRISLAHKDDVAVAIAGEGDVGIDVERVEPRGEAFDGVAFADEERALAVDDEWRARLWAAKEAAAKARGTGLAGHPRRFAVTARNGDRLCVDGLWIETVREGEWVIAWTVA